MKKTSQFSLVKTEIWLTRQLDSGSFAVYVKICYSFPTGVNKSLKKTRQKKEKKCNITLQNYMR